MRRDTIPAEQRRHYTEQKFEPNPYYHGPCGKWTEEEATAIFRELLDYFVCDIPPPPVGLPGRNLSISAEAFELLEMGAEYFMAVVRGQTGRQHSLHSDMKDHLRTVRSDARTALQEELIARDMERRPTRFTPFVEDTSLVYFIGSAMGQVKIGKARVPERRLKELQTSHPAKLTILATCEGGHECEQGYHKRFAAHRLHGEWFERCPEIEAEITRLTNTSEVSHHG